MVFLRWLIRNDDPRRILAAIDALEPGVEFTWGFSELADTIAALPPRRRVVAHGCVDFFEGRIDREALGELVAGA